MKRTKPTVFRVTVLILCGILSLFVFSLFLRIVITEKDPYNKFMTTLLVTLLFALPIAVHFLLGDLISDFTIAFYAAFLFLASFLGQVLRFNNYFPWYDKFAHFTFGYVACIIGLFLLCKLSDYTKHSPALVAVYVFCVSMCLAALWEIMEFISSEFLGQTAQGAPQQTVDGNYVVDITDTMLDIICNLGGAVVFLIHFFIHKLTGKSLLIDAIVKDFSAKHMNSTKKISDGEKPIPEQDDCRKEGSSPAKDK